MQVHANVCVASVVVTQTLDWKLHAFDVLSEFDGNNPTATGPMLVSIYLIICFCLTLEVMYRPLCLWALTCNHCYCCQD